MTPEEFKQNALQVLGARDNQMLVRDLVAAVIGTVREDIRPTAYESVRKDVYRVMSELEQEGLISIEKEPQWNPHADAAVLTPVSYKITAAGRSKLVTPQSG